MVEVWVSKSGYTHFNNTGILDIAAVCTLVISSILGIEEGKDDTPTQFSCL